MIFSVLWPMDGHTRCYVPIVGKQCPIRRTTRVNGEELKIILINKEVAESNDWSRQVALEI